MRRVVIAASFDREAEAIGVGIEERFGEAARRKFVDDLEHICTLIGALPRTGKLNHGYNTKLGGYVFDRNWIFFDFDDDSVHFIHIVDQRRSKKSLLSLLADN